MTDRSSSTLSRLSTAVPTREEVLWSVQKVRLMLLSLHIDLRCSPIMCYQTTARGIATRALSLCSYLACHLLAGELYFKFTLLLTTIWPPSALTSYLQSARSTNMPICAPIPSLQLLFKRSRTLLSPPLCAERPLLPWAGRACPYCRHQTQSAIAPCFNRPENLTFW